MNSLTGESKHSRTSRLRVKKKPDPGSGVATLDYEECKDGLINKFARSVTPNQSNTIDV